MLHNGSLSSPKMMMGMRMVLVVGSGVTEGSRDKDEYDRSEQPQSKIGRAHV